MASILKGAPVVAAMNERNAALCEQLKTKGIVPTLAVVRVGARPDDLSYEKGVLTRCGLHCAPAAHRSLGSFPEGSVRFSIGWANTEADIDAALEAIAEI